MSKRIVLLGLLPVILGVARADGRQWADSTGNYTVEATLVAFNDSSVVLQKESGELVAVPLNTLSQADRDYLRSKDGGAAAQRATDQRQVWTLTDGLKVVGKVVGYGRRELTLERRRGKTYVNDRQFENLPEVYRQMIPAIVAHFEKANLKNERDLASWLQRQMGKPRTFVCEGVMLELENGDEYEVPFFFFSEEDLRVLQPGWQRWLAAEKDQAQRQQQSFLLQSQAAAYQRDRAINQQIALMQLEMAGFQSGLFALWEVRLIPGPGVPSPPLSVVVPARDSNGAAQEAIRRHPGFTPAGISRVRRK